MYFMIVFILGALAANYLLSLPYRMCGVNEKEIEWLTLSDFEKRHFRVIPQYTLFFILSGLTLFCLFAWFCIFHLAWSYGKNDFMTLVNGFFFPVIMYGGCNVVTAMFEMYGGVTFSLGSRTRPTYCSLPPKARSVGQTRAVVWTAIITCYWALDHAAKYFLAL